MQGDGLNSVFRPFPVERRDPIAFNKAFGSALALLVFVMCVT